MDVTLKLLYRRIHCLKHGGNKLVIRLSFKVTVSQKYSVSPTSAFFTHSIIPTYCTTNVKPPGTISTGRSRLCNLYAGEPTFSCIIPEWSTDNLKMKSNHQFVVRQQGSMPYTQHFCTCSLRSQQHNST